MAITENSFTGDELKAALSTNKDALLPIVRGVLGTDFKFIVQDEAEHNTFKQNFEADVVGRKTNEWATGVEKDIKEITGIEKADTNEKWYDYHKRVLKTMKDSVGPLQAELDRLKAAGSPDKADKARIQQLEAAIAEKETNLTTELGKRDARIHELTVGNNLMGALANIRAKYKKDLPQSVIETVERVVLQDLIKIAKVQDDGKVLYMGEDGKPLTDKKLYQPLGEEELLTERLKDLIDVGKTQSGAGSGGAGGGTGGAGGGTGDGSVPEDITELPADVKTKMQLTAYMQKLGWTTSHPRWNAVQQTLGAKLPLR